MPLSEARVVKELLRQRIRVDRAYAMKLGACSLLESGGTSDIVEPVLCTYMDLDRLIENSGMTAEQRFVIGPDHAGMDGDGYCRSARLVPGKRCAGCCGTPCRGLWTPTTRNGGGLLEGGWAGTARIQQR